MELGPILPKVMPLSWNWRLSQGMCFSWDLHLGPTGNASPGSERKWLAAGDHRGAEPCKNSFMGSLSGRPGPPSEYLHRGCTSAKAGIFRPLSAQGKQTSGCPCQASLPQLGDGLWSPSVWSLGKVGWRGATFPLWSVALPLEGKFLAWQDCGSKRGWAGSQRRTLCRCYSGSGPHSTVLIRTSDLCLCLVAGSCPTLCDPMDCSPPGSSVHADSSGKNTRLGCHALLRGGGSSHPRDRTQVSRIAGGLFTVWTTREAREQVVQMGRRKLTLAAAHLVDTRPSSCPQSSPLWPRSQNIGEVGGLSPLNKSSWIYPGDVRILQYMQVNHGDTPY